MTNKIQLRRDTTANWERVNPILDDGEPGLDITLNQIKYGDGSTAWNDLAYAGGSPDRLTKDSYSVILGDDGILKMPPGNETTAGWIQWSHASDDLTNVAGAGFVDYFNAYTGLGLTAPTDTNAEKGIWFGTPADPTSPFQPETSMVFRNDTLYLPKNGFIKSHDINRVGYANLTTVGTTITIQTNDEYDWVFGTDGGLTLPGDIQAQEGNDINVVVYNPTVEGTPGGVTFSVQNRDVMTDSKTTQFDVGPADIVLTTDFAGARNEWTFGSNGSLTFPDTTIQTTAFNITKFGDGFSLDGNNKVVTRKLYSTDPGNTSTHYRLELTTGGTIKLPDSSEIIGSTLKGIHGTGELNYTGLTIGPSSGNSENTWMYVDAYDAYIATDYANNAYTWKFDRNGNLTIPGDIKSATTTGPVAIQSNDGNNTYTWNFGTDGTLTLPAGSGDEGAEIDFTKAPNSTLSGSIVVVDQWVDRIRFFEGGGTARGAYIDLKQAAAGVGTLLNNRVSAFVNAGTFVTMDNIKATVTTSSNRGLSLATVSGTATCFISGTYGMFGGATVGGSSAGAALTTTPSVSIFSWDFSSEGDTATYILNDGYTKSYRITMMIGGAFNNNMISIERLI